MKYFTKAELDRARKAVKKHKVLGISFIQVKLGLGYEKSATIFSKLKEEEEFKNYPIRHKLDGVKFVANVDKSTNKKKLAERLFNLFDDKIGRETVKFCLELLDKKDINKRSLFDDVQSKFGTGYARTVTNIQTARILHGIFNKTKNKRR